MFNIAEVPERIAEKIRGLEWDLDDMGESGSSIFLFEKAVLKIEKISAASDNELMMLNWLDGKLPVPKIIEAEKRDGYSFLLMTRANGEMACSESCLKNAEDTVTALADGLKTLWERDISGCPCSNTLTEKLVQAKYNIEHNLVDTDDFNEETFTTEGFHDIDELYGFLEQNRVKEDLVLSHGDYCLPNVFVSGRKAAGFIDWGRGGTADRWQDIALCLRSLRYNLIEYGGYDEKSARYYESLFFRELGIEPDKEKIRYYILLDELF